MCPRCGQQLNDLLFDERGDLVLELDHSNSPTLWYSCSACGETDASAGHRFTGLRAEHILRRVLAYENFSGGDEGAIGEAMSWIEECGSAEGALQHAAARRFAAGNFSRVYDLAIEIALTTHVERGLLDLELKHLERRWREEEEIAGIVDRELTPP